MVLRFEQVDLDIAKKSGTMNARMQQQTLAPALSFMPVQGGLLRRKYACGHHAKTSGECDQYKNNHLSLQRQGANLSEVSKAPSIVHEVLRSPGQPLGSATRAFLEPRFGHDFSQVRVHTDSRAAESVRAVNARAYTVGRDVVFGSENYAPNAADGRRLLAHELTHTIQQSANGDVIGSRLTIDNPASAAEKEADIAAERVVTDVPVFRSLTSSELMIQRETPGGEAKDKPEEKEASEVITEGLKTVAEQAKDNNPKVKKVIIDPLKDRLKLQWERLSTGDKAVAVGWSAATLGMAGGALLSDPGGRKILEDVNLATPFTLIPYMPLDSFKYKLPSGDSPEKRLFVFETGFDAEDLINRYTEPRGLPKMALKVNMQWGFDPATERLKIFGGDATIGVVPGLSLSAGVYKDILRPPQSFIGPGAQMTRLMQRIPELGKPTAIPDVRVMLTVDLMKFKPSDLVRQFKAIF